MKKILRAGFVIAFGAIGLAGCGGGGDSDGGGLFPTPPVVVVTPQNNFGATFAQAFKKDANDDPVDPVPDSALPAISLMAEPADIPS